MTQAYAKTIIKHHRELAVLHLKHAAALLSAEKEGVPPELSDVLEMAVDAVRALRCFYGEFDENPGKDDMGEEYAEPHQTGL